MLSWMNLLDDDRKGLEVTKRKPPSQRPERQMDPAALEAAQLAEEVKVEAKKAAKAERRAENIARPTHDAGGAGLSGQKSASAGSQPQIRRSKSGGGG